MVETFITLAESTLGSPAGSTDATFTLAAGAPFNVPGQYRLRLDDSIQNGGIATRYELCRATFNAGNVVNAFRSGADLEGSTAQAWPAGTKVVAVVTAAALKTYTSGGPYKVRATQGGGQGIPSSAWTKLTSMTSLLDPNGNWSAANNNYTVAVPGSYSVWAHVMMSGTPGGAAPQFRSSVWVNGAEVIPGVNLSLLTTSAFPNSAASDMIPLNAGDTVDLRVYQSSGFNYSTLAASLALHYLSSS